MNVVLKARGLKTGDRVGAAIALTLGFAFGATAVVSCWNIHGEQGYSRSLSLPIVDKGLGGKRRDSHYVFVRWNGENERLIVRKSLYYRVEVGRDLNVRVSRGALSYPHVIAFLDDEPADQQDAELLRIDPLVRSADTGSRRLDGL